MIPFKRGINPLSLEEEITLGEWWSNKYLTKKASKLKPIWSWNGKYDLLKDALFSVITTIVPIAIAIH